MRSRRGSACARPTRPATPTSAACTGATRPTLALYHLVIDSTAMPLNTVIELIITAARAHEAPRPGSQKAEAYTADHDGYGTARMKSSS